MEVGHLTEGRRSCEGNSQPCIRWLNLTAGDEQDKLDILVVPQLEKMAHLRTKQKFDSLFAFHLFRIIPLPGKVCEWLVSWQEQF